MKKYILTIIITAIIFTGIGVVATTAITADQVNYDENTTVKDKIDNLYTRQENVINSLNTEINKNYVLKMYIQKTSAATTTTQLNLNDVHNISKYHYFKITTNTTSGTSVTCNTNALTNADRANNSWNDTPINVNQKYLVSDYFRLAFSISSSSNAAQCSYTITFSAS